MELIAGFSAFAIGCWAVRRVVAAVFLTPLISYTMWTVGGARGMLCIYLDLEKAMNIDHHK